MLMLHTLRTPRSSRVAGLTTLLLALSASGCADRPSPPFDDRAPADRELVRLEVTSSQYLDTVIYVGVGGVWHRIGDVPGLGSARIEIPAAIGPLPGEFHVRAHGIGSASDADYVSGPIQVGSGDVIELRLASVLRMSSWSIRHR
jgi:hypothetical protein